MYLSLYVLKYVLRRLIVHFIMIVPNVNEFCKELGMRLRKARISANKTQKELGVIAGVSSKVIGRMERGDASVSLAKWLNVTEIFGLLSTWQDVLQIKEDPFEEYDREQKRITDLMKRRVRHKAESGGRMSKRNLLAAKKKI